MGWTKYLFGKKKNAEQPSYNSVSTTGLNVDDTPPPSKQEEAKIEEREEVTPDQEAIPVQEVTSDQKAEIEESTSEQEAIPEQEAKIEESTSEQEAEIKAEQEKETEIEESTSEQEAEKEESTSEQEAEKEAKRITAYKLKERREIREEKEISEEEFFSVNVDYNYYKKFISDYNEKKYYIKKYNNELNKCIKKYPHLKYIILFLENYKQNFETPNKKEIYQHELKKYFEIYTNKIKRQMKKIYDKKRINAKDVYMIFKKIKITNKKDLKQIIYNLKNFDILENKKYYPHLIFLEKCLKEFEDFETQNKEKIYQDKLNKYFKIYIDELEKYNKEQLQKKNAKDVYMAFQQIKITNKDELEIFINKLKYDEKRCKVLIEYSKYLVDNEDNYMKALEKEEEEKEEEEKEEEEEKIKPTWYNRIFRRQGGTRKLGKPRRIKTIRKCKLLRVKTIRGGKPRRVKTIKKRKWSNKYKKSINCRYPKGFSQKQFCKSKKRR
jgi:hypothetical protein